MHIPANPERAKRVPKQPMVPPRTFAPSGASSSTAASFTTAAASIPVWAQQQPQPARGSTDQLARQAASEALSGKVERSKNKLDARLSEVRQSKSQDVGAAMAVAAGPAQPLLAELTRNDLNMNWGQFSWKSQAKTAASQSTWSQQEWDLWRIEKAAMSTRVSSGASVTPVVAIIPPANATHGMNVVSLDYEAQIDVAGLVLPTLKNHRPHSGPYVSWDDTEYWTNRCWYCLKHTQPAHTKRHCPEYITDMNGAIAHFLQHGNYYNEAYQNSDTHGE